MLPWRRAQVPLLRAGGRLVAIGDLAYAAGYAAEPGEPSWTVAWRGRPQLTESEATEVKLDALASTTTSERRRAPVPVAGRGAFR